jgi:hypothetical protein
MGTRRPRLPLVQGPLSAEGWGRVEKAAGSGKSVKDMLFLVPWVADGLTPAQLEAQSARSARDSG